MSTWYVDRKPGVVDIYKRFNPSTDNSMESLHVGPSVCLVIFRPRISSMAAVVLTVRWMTFPEIVPPPPLDYNPDSDGSYCPGGRCMLC